MNLNKKYFFPILAVLACTVLFYLIKFYGPAATENLYNKGSFAVLDQISGNEESGRSLGYYQGKIEKVLLGPIKSVAAGIALLIICLIYLPQASSWKIGFTILIYLIATRFESLWGPIYGESITGPFTDAMWLYQNNLNYFGLLHQNTFVQGGVQIYPTSLYPFFLAVMMKLFPSAKLFLFVMHLLNFIQAAIIAVILRKMALKHFNTVTAMCVALLFVSLPLFQSMVEVVNMEMSCLFFGVLTIWFLAKGRWMLASLMALSSLFVKDPGIIACIMVFIVGLYLLFFKPDSLGEYRLHPKERINIFLVGLGIFLIAIIKGIWRSKIIGAQILSNKLAFVSGWPNMVASPWFWIYWIVLVTLIIRLMKWWQVKPRDERSITKLVNDHLYILLCFVMAGLWFALYINFAFINHRYQFLLSAFFAFCFVYLITVILENKKAWQPGVFVFIIMFSFFCSHGFIYSFEKEKAYNPTQFERSLEYRNYLTQQILICNEIENKFSDFAIGAPFGLAQSLAWPQIGYVTKKLDVLMYGMPAILGIKSFKGLQSLDLSKTVWIGFRHDQVMPEITDYPIHPLDKIIEDVTFGDVSATIFMGGYGIEKMRKILVYILKMQPTLSK